MENTLQIGDRTYGFGTIPALEAVAVEVSIARVVGEPLFKAFTEAKKKPGEMDDEAATAAGASAVGLLLSKMNPEELIATMQTVFKYVSFKNEQGQGTRVDINTHFTGRNKELWQVFLHALKHNFGDFLPAGLSRSLGNVIPK